MLRSTQEWPSVVSRGRLPVLAYHAVPDAARFEAQMRLLSRTMRPVSAERAARAILGREKLPPRAVLVTFDDGDRSLLTEAAPVLSRVGVPALAFVVTGILGTTDPLWWQEVEALVERGARAPELSSVPPAGYVTALKRVDDGVRRRILEVLRADAPGPPPRIPQLAVDDLAKLAAAGIEIANHTHSHPCLDRCDDGSVEREIRTAHAMLAAVLPRPPRLFAYPNGNFDGRAAAALRALEYDAAFLFDHRVARVPARDPYRVSRLRVSATASLRRFAAIVSGVHPFLYHGIAAR